MRATLKRKGRLLERLTYNSNSKYRFVHTFHIQVSLSSNGHEKLKKRVNFKKIVNFKKVNRDPEKGTYTRRR